MFTMMLRISLPSGKSHHRGEPAPAVTARAGTTSRAGTMRTSRCRSPISISRCSGDSHVSFSICRAVEYLPESGIRSRRNAATAERALAASKHDPAPQCRMSATDHSRTTDEQWRIRDNPVTARHTASHPRPRSGNWPAPVRTSADVDNRHSVAAHTGRCTPKFALRHRRSAQRRRRRERR